MQHQLLKLGGERWLVIRPDDAIEYVNICRVLAIPLEVIPRRERATGYKRTEKEKDRVCDWCGFFFKIKRHRRVMFCKKPGCQKAYWVHLKCKQTGNMEEWKIKLLRRNLKGAGLMK